MGILTALPVDEIRQRGSIRDGDVARLRAAYSEAATVSNEEAEALFALHAATPVQHPAWTDLFLEIIADYIVEQAAPEGYVDAWNARWLIDRVSTFGRIETSTEMALLVHVLERARWTPPTLAAFALDQIRHAVETGKGPLRPSRAAATGNIAPTEVEMAARIIRAAGGESSVAITRTEADALIRINRAIAPGGSSPAWSVLLVRTLGSGVLAALGHAVAPRREITDTLTSPDETAGLVAMLLSLGDRGARPSHRPGQAPSGGCQVWRSARILTPEEHALTRLERQRLEIVTNEVIEETDDIWLMDRLSESDPNDENEAALLAFVVREASRLPPELAQFAARRAIAA